MNSLRKIPSVEKVLQALGSFPLPRPVLVALVRDELQSLREEAQVPGFEAVLERMRNAADSLWRSRIQPVINGTGILVHTNLGRAPLSPAVVETLTQVASSYNNLEFDLNTGERGGRAAYLERSLALLCKAEAATVVNNCAAALVLILQHLTREKREVIISRGELIQIGGGFRIPDILEAGGARLREVGTTNRTALQDYERAIGHQTGLILKVHQSNFYMGGFVESPDTAALAALAKAKGVPIVEDLGSGAVVETEQFAGLQHEPTPAEVLGKGVDLVCFSGDKLFGGPQAGIIAGRNAMVAALKREPFGRALRCDKLILCALQTTADNYLRNTAVAKASRSRLEASDVDTAALREISAAGAGDASGLPLVEMLQTSEGELRRRAERISCALEAQPVTVTIGVGEGQMGGGTLPRSAILSVTLDLVPEEIGLEEFARRLRAGSPPVIGFVRADRFRIDLRTVFPRQDEELARAVCTALNAGKEER